MELRIQPYTAPEPIQFNYEELKQIITQTSERYANTVYTSDQISEAKADRAKLKRLQKALNDERINREREYMAEFNVFKGQINEIIGIIDTAVSNVDGQVKASEERDKQKKREDIEAYWQEQLEAGKVPTGIILKQIANEKWLNATFKMKAIQTEIDERLEKIASELAVIENLPAYAFEAKETYLDTLDLGRAIQEAHRLTEQAEKRKAWEAEQERRRAAQEAARAAQEAARATEVARPTVSTPEVQSAPVEPVKPQEEPEPTENVYVLRLELQVTKNQAAMLKAFLNENGINHHKI